MRLCLIACALVLALLPVEAIASPMVGHVGRAEVTLTLSPDPPQQGPEHALVAVSGVTSNALDGTKVTYTSLMPAMTMDGAAGSAHAVPGRIGVWEFDLPMSTATQWAVTLNFSGAVNGSTTFSFDVIGPSAQVAAGPMDMSGSGDGTWRIAAFALAILLVLVGVIAWNLARARGSSSRPNWVTPSTAAIAGAAVIVILGLAVLQSKFAPPASDMSAMSNVPGSARVPVTLGRAGHVQSGATIIAPGIIEPLLTQNVSSRTAGMVQSVDVYVGDKVARGQTLVTLSEPDLGVQASAADAAARSDYNSATAALIDAQHRAPNEFIIAQQDARAKAEQARYWRNELQREKRLLDQGGVSSQEYEDERAQAAAAASAVVAQRQVDNARANIDMARAGAAAALAKASSSSSSAAAQSILAGYTTLTASDDAVVVGRLVDPGSYVDSGTAILRVAVIGKVRIKANVSQEDLAGIVIGTPLVATVDGGQPIRARVTAVQPAADPTTHTAMVEAVVDNRGDRLRPGSYARVSIGPIAGARVQGTTTPSASVIGSGVDAAVWTDVNGTAHRVAVRVLSDDGQIARVTGDLKPGDRVVVEGGQTLEEGTPIAESSK